MVELIEMIEALLQSIADDEGGNPTRPGHGGLLSRHTLEQAGKVRLAVSEFKARGGA